MGKVIRRLECKKKGLDSRLSEGRREREGGRWWRLVGWKWDGGEEKDVKKVEGGWGWVIQANLSQINYIHICMNLRVCVWGGCWGRLGLRVGCLCKCVTSCHSSNIFFILLSQPRSGTLNHSLSPD